MTDRLKELIALADGAEDAAGRIANTMAEKYPLGADFERYQDEIRKMVAFSNEGDTVKAMAELLVKAEETLQQCHKLMGNEGCQPDEDVANTLAEIQAFKENR